MGSAASTPHSEESKYNYSRLNNEKALFAQFCELEHSCDQVGLSQEEIYRFLSERYLAYCESDDKSLNNFKDQPVPLPVRNISKAKTINAPELIKIILCSGDYSEDTTCSVCDIKFKNRRLLETHLKYSENHVPTCKDCPDSPYKIQDMSNGHLQERFNTNTVDGDVIEVAQKWKAAVSKTSSPTNRSRYQDFTNTICFIPNEVKVLFQGLKTFHRSSASSVVVDLRVYFHTESQCIEIVPHIVQTVSAVGTGFRPITAPLNDSDKTTDFPLKEAPLDRPATRKNNFLPRNRNQEAQSQSSKPSLTIDTSAAEETNTDDATTQLYIPLPRIYLDYNTLLGTVMELPNSGTNLLEHTVATAAEQYADIYQQQDMKRSCAVDVCMDRVLVHYVTSHLQMSPETVTTPTKAALKHTPKASRRLSISGLLPVRISPKSASEQPTSPAANSSTEARVSTSVMQPSSPRITVLQNQTSEMSEEQRIRASLKDYTIRFDDSECGISPVFNAPKVLVPIPAVCADQIYIYCKGKQNNSFE